GNLVVDDLLGLARRVARLLLFALLLGVGAGQFVADRNTLCRALGGRGAFLAGLAGAYHPLLRIERVRRLGDAVEIEIGRELDARPARPDHRRDDPFDLLAQAPLVRDLILVGATRDLVAATRAVGE